jgi:phage-related protein
MPSFPSIAPSYGAQRASSPKTRSVQFGDGYEMRTVWGENQDPKLWQLVWRNISETDSDTIEAFFEARKGQESFDWTPLGSSSSKKWICKGWTKTISYLNRATIQATFLQVFEP